MEVHSRTAGVGAVDAEEGMREVERTPVWALLLFASVWLLLLANIAYDYFHDHRITPFSVIMFFALLGGSTLVPRYLKQPNYSLRDKRARVIFSAVLLAVWGIILATIILVRIKS